MRVFVVLMICCGVLLPATGNSAEPLDLRALIEQVERQYNGESSAATVAMTVVTGHWERHLTLASWSRGRDRFLIRILEPAKEKGVATLKVDDDVWNYLPKVDRVIRIPPSMMGGAWMGSHITNDDLVKANRIDEDYDFELLAEDDRFWLIAAIPKPDAAVVWGRLRYRIIKSPLVPSRIEYFDEEDILIRRIDFADVQTVSGRVVPLRMTVIPVARPGEKTVMQYRDLEFDMALPDTFFSLRQLKGRH